MVQEYLRAFYRNYPQWRNLRLGVAADPEEARLMQVTLKYADAIVVTDTDLLLFEFKMEPKLDAIGQLQGYEELIPLTPELSKFAHLPIKKILVTTREDRNVRATAENNGIQYVIFRPSNIEQYEKSRFRLP